MMLALMRKIITEWLNQKPFNNKIAPEEYEAFFSSRVWRVMQYRIMLAMDADHGALISTAGQREKDMAAGRWNAFEEVLNLEHHLRDNITTDGDLLFEAQEEDERLKQILELIQR